MKTITYQIKKVDPIFWKKVRRICLEKDMTIRDFILIFLEKAVKDFEKETI